MKKVYNHPIKKTARLTLADAKLTLAQAKLTLAKTPIFNNSLIV